MRSSAAPSAESISQQSANSRPLTLIERRRAYEEAHSDIYFKTPKISESDEWEAWREGKGEAEDEMLSTHTSLGVLLDYLEGQDH